MRSIDAAALALLAGRHYGYYHVPDALQSEVFGLLASGLIMLLVLGSELPRVLKAWAFGEEAIVAGCSAVYMAWPWEASNERCSDQLGLKLGTIGVAWLALALWAYNRTGVQVTKDKK